MKTKKYAVAAAALVSAAAIVPAAASAGRDVRPLETYVITIENLTAPGSQPLSPVGTVVHDRGVDVWSVGSPASAAVAAIAEDAGLQLFANTYRQLAGVSSSTIGGAAPFGPGSSVTFEVQARRGDRLSLVTMLVNTNDAFTGLDSVELDKRSQDFYVGAYDAGTEINNELPGFLPGPAGNSPGVRAPEGNLIAPHPGILGTQGGIDPTVYDWDDPVAHISIERRP